MKDCDSMTVVVDGRIFKVLPRPLDAEEVLAIAGMFDGTVIRVDGGRASHFAPDTAIEFDKTTQTAFRTFHRGPIRQLRVNRELWEWGSPGITEAEVREIAGLAGGQSVHLHGSAEPIRPGSVIDLTGTWPPQLELGSSPALPSQDNAMVPVIVNGRSVTLERPEVSFEDLVRVAFPGADVASPTSRALTVTYRHGPPARPEGSLVSSETVQARKGEIFHVTATDKS